MCETLQLWRHSSGLFDSLLFGFRPKEASRMRGDLQKKRKEVQMPCMTESILYDALCAVLTALHLLSVFFSTFVLLSRVE